MEANTTIFTGACFFCLAGCNNVWCDACEQDFIINVGRCPVCARRTNNDARCGACIKQPPYFFSTEVLFNYQYPGKQLIQDFKFNKRPELSGSFAKKLSNKLISKQNLPEIIIPVPLHKTRQRERGYNQSLELARDIAKRTGLSIDTTLCKRIKNTGPQSSLSGEMRKNNVKGAFVLTEKCHPNHIAIVDDVITTGSTVNEIAALFIKSGCHRVDVWAIART